MYNDSTYETDSYKIAFRDMKAALFDKVAAEEIKLSFYEEKLSKMSGTEEEEKYRQLCEAQDECLKRILQVTAELTEALNDLDYYSRDLKSLLEGKVKESISNIDDRKINRAYNKDLKVGKKKVEEAAENMINVIASTDELENEKDGLINNIRTIQAGPDVDNKPSVDVTHEVVEEPKEDVKEEAQTDTPAETTMVEQAEPEKKSILDNIVIGNVFIPKENVVSNNKEGAVEIPQEVATTPENENVEETSVEAAPVEEKTDTVAKEEVVEIPQEVVSTEKENVEENSVEVAPVEENTDTVATEEVVETPQEVVVPTEKENVEETSVEAAPVEEKTDTVATEEVVGTPQESIVLPKIEESEVTPIEAAPVEEKTDTVTTEEVVDASQESIVLPKIEKEEVTPIEAAPVEEKTDTVATEEVAEAPQEVIPTEKEHVEETPVEAAPVEEKTDTVTTEEVAEAPMEPIDEMQQSVNKSLDTLIDNKQAIKDSDVGIIKKAIFYKLNNDAVKAILTTNKQITKLRNSREKQKALLRLKDNTAVNLLASNTFHATSDELENQQDLEKNLINNGLLEPDVVDKQKTIENMLEEANELYKQGKVDEAQQMYDKISSLNKELQDDISGNTK